MTLGSQFRWVTCIPRVANTHCQFLVCSLFIQALVFLISHFPTQVDAQRLEAIIQAGVIQVVQADEVETNVGADDDIGSDGEADGDVDGQLEGESGDEAAEG